MDARHARTATGLFRYDAQRRRVWVCGQRVHHGLTGALLALTGAVLMVHDWKDRSMWFEKGAGSQR
jgi:hypothetical protein